MANDVFGQLDTTEISSKFNDFLGGQGLGDMNPSSASRFREGVEVSPMDDILKLNGYDLDSLFARKLPEPPVLATLDSLDKEIEGANSSSQDKAGKNNSKDDKDQPINTQEVVNTKSAISSLGLSDEELRTLNSLLTSGGSTSVGKLPGPLIQLLQNPGVGNMETLVLQLGALYSLVGNQPLPANKDLAQLMLEWLDKLGVTSTIELLFHLEANPAKVKEALRDPLTGISIPLASTSILLQVKNAFSNDPIIGGSLNETLLGSRAGGIRLVGGGGMDIFVIPLSIDPLPASTPIADFDPLTGSKIVLDTTNLSREIGAAFKIAKTSKKLSKFVRTKTMLIFDQKTHGLLYNQNKRGEGLGENGGIIATFENGSIISSKDILVFQNNNISNLSDSPIL